MHALKCSSALNQRIDRLVCELGHAHKADTAQLRKVRGQFDYRYVRQ